MFAALSEFLQVMFAYQTVAAKALVENGYGWAPNRSLVVCIIATGLCETHLCQRCLFPLQHTKDLTFLSWFLMAKLQRSFGDNGQWCQSSYCLAISLGQSEVGVTWEISLQFRRSRRAALGAPCLQRRLVMTRMTTAGRKGEKKEGRFWRGG